MAWLLAGGDDENMFDPALGWTARSFVRAVDSRTRNMLEILERATRGRPLITYNPHQTIEARIRLRRCSTRTVKQAHLGRNSIQTKNQSLCHAERAQIQP